MKTGHLLLVDDDRHVLDSMAGWLRDQGYPVHTASGRDEALKIIKERHIDLVLADIRLADGDGFEILGWWRYWPKCPLSRKGISSSMSVSPTISALSWTGKTARH
jgi:DNA-binding response OmpR family regulator